MKTEPKQGKMYKFSKNWKSIKKGDVCLLIEVTKGSNAGGMFTRAKFQNIKTKEIHWFQNDKLPPLNIFEQVKDSPPLKEKASTLEVKLPSNHNKTISVSISDNENFSGILLTYISKDKKQKTKLYPIYELFEDYISDSDFFDLIKTIVWV
ncbi:MAG: hypothetical protein ACP5OG_02275 [Candidatus Nanoarchaeia archaeon]